LSARRVDRRQAQASMYGVIIGRAPSSAERCALLKTSARSSSANPRNCPLAMTEFATSNSPHIGQAMPTLPIVEAIVFAMEPQIGQSMLNPLVAFLCKTTQGGLARPAGFAHPARWQKFRISHHWWKIQKSAKSETLA